MLYIPRILLGSINTLTPSPSGVTAVNLLFAETFPQGARRAGGQIPIGKTYFRKVFRPPLRGGTLLGLLRTSQALTQAAVGVHESGFDEYEEPNLVQTRCPDLVAHRRPGIFHAVC